MYVYLNRLLEKRHETSQIHNLSLEGGGVMGASGDK